MKNQLAFIVLALPFLFGILFFGLDYGYVLDEISYEQTILLFVDKLPEVDLSTYFVDSPEYRDINVPIVATPPLPLIMGTGILSLFGESLTLLRLMSIVMGLLTVWLFYLICQDLKVKKPLMVALLFLFYPYMFLMSFLVQSEIYGIFFGMIALRFYLKDKVLLGGLFSVLAIFSRQYFLFLPVGYALYTVWTQREKFCTTKHFTFEKDSSLYQIALLVLPFLLIAPLFLSWGSMTPPAYDLADPEWSDHAMTFSFEKLLFLLIVIGFTYLPLIVHHRKAHWELLILPVFLFLFFPISTCEGILCKAMAPLSESLIGIIFLLLAFVGTLVLRKPKDATDNKLVFWIGALTLLIMLDGLVRQRYYLLFIPLLHLYLYRHAAGKLIKIWLVVQSILTVLYTTYKISHGVFV